MILTKSQWKEFEDAGEIPDQDSIDQTVQALHEALEETNRVLQAVLSNKPVRNADEVIVHNDKLLN
jgi:hypothetical protein